MNHFQLNLNLDREELDFLVGCIDVGCLNDEQEDRKIGAENKSSLFNHEVSLDEQSGDKVVSETIALHLVPEDVLHNITTFLSVQSLVALNSTSQEFHTITNERSFWRSRFESLASSKVNIPNYIKSAAYDEPKIAMRLAHQDKGRQWLTKSELIGATWSFWFKESAGDDWTSWDPYWRTNGCECRRLKFLPDGTVMQLDGSDGEDEVDLYDYGKQSFNKSYMGSDRIQRQQQSKRKREQVTLTSNTDAAARDFTAGTKDTKTLRVASDVRVLGREDLLGDAPFCSMIPGSICNHSENTSTETFKSRSRRLRPVFFDEPNIPHLNMCWRFITEPLDFPRHDYPGGYLRLSVAGREVPTYVVRRLSEDNWGFIMESCWGIFASFDITEKKSEKCQSSGRDELDKPNRKVENNFAGWDLVTTDLQWREVLLYNNGNSTLPERSIT